MCAIDPKRFGFNQPGRHVQQRANFWKERPPISKERTIYEGSEIKSDDKAKLIRKFLGRAMTYRGILIKKISHKYLIISLYSFSSIVLFQKFKFSKVTDVKLENLFGKIN